MTNFETMMIIGILGLAFCSFVLQNKKFGLLRCILEIIFLTLIVFGIYGIMEQDNIENGKNRVKISTPDLGQQLVVPIFEQSIPNPKEE